MAQPYVQAGRFRRAMRAFATTALGTKLFAPILNRPDDLVLRLTRGRRTALHALTGVPTVPLTTIDARPGQARTIDVVGLPTPMASVSSASNFGRASHPA